MDMDMDMEMDMDMDMGMGVCIGMGSGIRLTSPREARSSSSKLEPWNSERSEQVVLVPPFANAWRFCCTVLRLEASTMPCFLTSWHIWANRADSAVWAPDC